MKDQIQQAALEAIKEKYHPFANPLKYEHPLAEYERFIEGANWALSQQQPVTPPMRELDSLTDEEAIEVANIIDSEYPSEHKVQLGKYIVRKWSVPFAYPDGLEWANIIDYLRSRGYNIPNAYPVPVDNWIRVSDRLPDFVNQVNEIIECSEGYLVIDKLYGEQVATCIRYKIDTIDPLFPERKKGYVLWETGNYNLYNVTHWQPLPTAPKQ